MNRFFYHTFLSLLLSHALTMSAWATGAWHAVGHNTSGWQYMTPDEHIEYQRHMRGFDTYAECSAYETEHHAHMAERASRVGKVLQRQVQSACAQLRQSGRLK